MTAQQLKNSILQMAVQGKLVPQDPNDEPASVLMERIRAEKEEMIKEGKIKKEKNLSVIFRGSDNLFYEKVGDQEPVCIADEVPFEIPESWEWVRFGTVVINFDSQRQPVTKSDRKSVNGYYDYYGATGAIDKVDDYLFDGEYLMIGEDGGNFFTDRDNSFIANGKFWANNHVHVVKPVFVNIFFLKFFLDSCNLGAMGLINGIAVPKLNQQHMNSILVPVPPIEEQNRVVTRINVFLPLIDYYDITEKARILLDKQFPDQLKKSILQRAVEGKLVPQDPSDEPASVLLEKIRSEKEQLIQAGKIKRDKHESVIYRRDGSYYEKIDNEERRIDDEVPFNIPESWEWVRIRSVGEIFRGNGIKRNDLVMTGCPCVRYGELYTTYQTSFVEAISFIPSEIDKKCKHIRYGDILMTLTGENKPDIAKAVAYLGTESIAIGGDLAYWSHHGLNPLFLSYVLASPYVIGRKVDLASGDIIVHISVEKIGGILFPIPPYNEQNRIVNKIEDLLSMVDYYTDIPNT